MMIFHIATRDAWEKAQAAGSYEIESLQTEGFIHFSTPEQVLAVAEHRFRGRQDLILLAINPDKLQAELRYEDGKAPAGHIEQFPHLYGPLNLDAVERSAVFFAGEDGSFLMPTALLDI